MTIFASVRRIPSAVRSIPALGAALLAALGPLPASGQEEEDVDGGPWSVEAQASLVATTGNAHASTLGLDGQLLYERGPSRWLLEAGFLRTESGTTVRRAVGTSPDDFQVEEETDLELTAEKYSARTRYDHVLSERFFLYGAVDWLRDTFAGVDSRFVFVAGAGNSWIDTDRTKLRTDYAATLTAEDVVVDDPTVPETFAGARLGVDFSRQLTGTTKVASQLVVDENLAETEDLRADWKNSLQVSISDALALKPGVRLVWRNQPALTTVPLVAPDGTDTGETVAVPLAELDAYYTLAVVVTP